MMISSRSVAVSSVNEEAGTRSTGRSQPTTVGTVTRLDATALTGRASPSTSASLSTRLRQAGGIADVPRLASAPARLQPTTCATPRSTTPAIQPKKIHGPANSISIEGRDRDATPGSGGASVALSAGAAGTPAAFPSGAVSSADATFFQTTRGSVGGSG